MNNENEFDKYLIIVSKAYPLTEEKEQWIEENFNFVPYTDEDGQSRMEEETYKAYTALVNLMRKKYHLDVNSHSAYRTASFQRQLKEDLAKTHTEEWVKAYVAGPGESEHQTGLAFDLRFKYSFVPESLRGKANSVAKKTGISKKVFKTIEKEAVQFGLIKRYQAGKEDITGFKEEDWHFRYVGPEHAKKMYESGMCLEEYVRDLKLSKEKVKVR